MIEWNVLAKRIIDELIVWPTVKRSVKMYTVQ